VYNYIEGIEQMAKKRNKPLEDSYFDLIIKTILNEVYFPGEHVNEGRVWPKCPAMSMIGRSRLENVLSLAKEKIEQGIKGDFIEAGIWKGGVIALMSAVLNVYGDTSRQVYGADSFKGIPPAKPDLYPADKAHLGCDKLEILSNNSRVEVESLLQRFGLLSPQVTLVEGWFKDTLDNIPNENFALIRLDGDSYESTMQSLQALYPKLSDGGSIIIDDYHSWHGCKVAVDEWRTKHHIKDPLIDIDWTAVYWTKSSKSGSSKRELHRSLIENFQNSLTS
jgi:O-methyltransferase